MLLRAAMSLNPKVYFLGFSFSLMFLLVHQKNHQVSSFPTAPEQEMEEFAIWSEGSIQEIYHWFECSDHHSSDAALEAHDGSVWRKLHKTYKTVLPTSTALPPLDHKETSGYQVPVKVKKMKREDDDEVDEERELGVFAAEDIPKGTLVWKSTYTAHFDTGPDFRSFARALPTNLACDVLSWAYPRYLDKEAVICVDLDHGSLMGSCEEDEGQECNLHVHPDKDHSKTGCDMEFYASRDIKTGEVLLLNHDYDKDAEALEPLGLAHDDDAVEDDEDDEDGDDDDEDDEHPEDDEL